MPKGEWVPVTEKQALNFALEHLNRAREVAWEKGRARIDKKELERRRKLNESKRQDNNQDPEEDWAQRARREEARTGVPAFLQFGFGISGSGSRESQFDPQKVGEVFEKMVTSRRWDRALVGGRVVAEWELVVGEKIAQHSRADKYENGVLYVSADSTVWAQQLRLLLPQLMAKLDERYGSGVIQKLIVSGPKQRSWKHGPLSVPGRGPRDTYG